RGDENRKLPIQADYICKHVSTKKSENIKVMLTDFDEDEGVVIVERPAAEAAAEERASRPLFYYIVSGRPTFRALVMEASPMLTDIEKERIREEESFRIEVRRLVAPPE